MASSSESGCVGLDRRGTTMALAAMRPCGQVLQRVEQVVDGHVVGSDELVGGEGGSASSSRARSNPSRS